MVMQNAVERSCFSITTGMPISSHVMSQSSSVMITEWLGR